MPNNNHEIFLTVKNIENLKKELDDLVNVQRPKVIEELKEARSQGDLSENADYDAARSHQANIESRINEIESLVKKAKVLRKKTNLKSKQDKVEIGSKVLFHHSGENKDIKVEILGPLEADPFKNIISNTSPIAEALLGHKKGDNVIMKIGSKNFKLKILKIS